MESQSLQNVFVLFASFVALRESMSQLPTALTIDYRAQSAGPTTPTRRNL